MLTVTKPKVRLMPEPSLVRFDRATLRCADGTGNSTLAWKHQPKLTAPTHLAINEQLCVMRYRYVLDDRQTQSGATCCLTAAFIDAIKPLR